MFSEKEEEIPFLQNTEFHEENQKKVLPNFPKKKPKIGMGKLGPIGQNKLFLEHV